MLKVLSQICGDTTIVVPSCMHCTSFLVQRGNRAVGCNANRYHWECCWVKKRRFTLIWRFQSSQKKYTFVVQNRIWQCFSVCFLSLLLRESSCGAKEKSRGSSEGCDEALSLGGKRGMNVCSRPLQLSLLHVLWKCSFLSVTLRKYLRHTLRCVSVWAQIALCRSDATSERREENRISGRVERTRFWFQASQSRCCQILRWVCALNISWVWCI